MWGLFSLIKNMKNVLFNIKSVIAGSSKAVAGAGSGAGAGAETFWKSEPERKKLFRLNNTGVQGIYLYITPGGEGRFVLRKSVLLIRLSTGDICLSFFYFYLYGPEHDGVVRTIAHAQVTRRPVCRPRAPSSPFTTKSWSKETLHWKLLACKDGQVCMGKGNISCHGGGGAPVITHPPTSVSDPEPHSICVPGPHSEFWVLKKISLECHNLLWLTS